MSAILLPLLLALLLSPPAGGSLSGQVVLLKDGAPRPDASHAVAWIEGLRRPGAPSGVVRGEMKSEKKKFTPRVVALPTSAAMEFPNADPIYHNVFSVSGGNRFDLGLYRSGASRRKAFDEPGLVRVYCNIHPQMVGFVMVVDSDYWAITGADGSFRFDGIPAGPHVLRVWHEEGGETRLPVTVSSPGDSPVTVRLDASGHRPQAHKNKYGRNYPPQPAADDERY